MKQDEEIELLLGEIPGLAIRDMAAESPSRSRPLSLSPLPDPAFYRGASAAPSVDEDLVSALWRLNVSEEQYPRYLAQEPMHHTPDGLRHRRYPDKNSAPLSTPFSIPDNQASVYRSPPEPHQWNRPDNHPEAIRYFLIQQQLQHQRELMLENQTRALAARNSAMHGLFQRYHHHQPFLYGSSLSNGYSDQYNVPRSLFKGGYRDSSREVEYTSVEALRGRILETAKDQHGCRFLQRRFADGSIDELRLIFEEVIEHVDSLMTDAFGNYLMQKIFEYCDEFQRMQILKLVTEDRKLVDISLDMHGTRAVQKLIDTLRTPEQVDMVVGCLRRGIVSLIKDTNGNHVVQRCLMKLTKEDNKFIFDAMTSHFRELAVHRHGCCVLQRCIDSAPDSVRCRLIGEVTANALELSQDAYGNYVVQYVLEGYPAVCREIMLRLSGKFAELSMQKFSSNVVEKCLSVFRDEDRAAIVQELISSSSFEQLLHHEYGNYVIQSSLAASKGVLRDLLVDAIQPYVSALRTSPYGKRILKSGTSKRL